MRSILIIDDSMTQQRIMKKLLQGKYDTLTSESGIDGIKIAKEKQPDLILLDYDMPLMSGKETFLRLQRQEETKDIPVIFLTGLDKREYVEAVLKLRPKGYLLKPVEQDRLIHTIKSVLPD